MVQVAEAVADCYLCRLSVSAVCGPASARLAPVNDCIARSGTSSGAAGTIGHSPRRLSVQEIDDLAAGLAVEMHVDEAELPETRSRVDSNASAASVQLW